MNDDRKKDDIAESLKSLFGPEGEDLLGELSSSEEDVFSSEDNNLFQEQEDDMPSSLSGLFSRSNDEDDLFSVTKDEPLAMPASRDPEEIATEEEAAPKVSENKATEEEAAAASQPEIQKPAPAPAMASDDGEVSERLKQVLSLLENIHNRLERLETPIENPQAEDDDDLFGSPLALGAGTDEQIKAAEAAEAARKAKDSARLETELAEQARLANERKEQERAQMLEAAEGARRRQAEESARIEQERKRQEEDWARLQKQEEEKSLQSRAIEGAIAKIKAGEELTDAEKLLLASNAKEPQAPEPVVEEKINKEADLGPKEQIWQAPMSNQAPVAESLEDMLANQDRPVEEIIQEEAKPADTLLEEQEVWDNPPLQEKRSPLPLPEEEPANPLGSLFAQNEESEESSSSFEDMLSQIGADKTPAQEAPAPEAPQSRQEWPQEPQEEAYTPPVMPEPPAPSEDELNAILDGVEDELPQDMPQREPSDFGMTTGRTLNVPDFDEPKKVSILAQDILWKIGVPDSASESEYREQQALTSIREEAQASAASARPSGGAGIKVAALPWDRIPRGKPPVISITSPKGGSGKSSTAMNLGAWMANNASLWAENKRTKEKREVRTPRILVFDGDIGNGTLALRVAGRERPNVIELINAMDEGWRPADFADLKDKYLITRNDMPNLSILAAPSDPDAVEDLYQEDYSRLLDLLRQYFDIIIIDTGTEMWAEYNQFWARSADTMYVLTLPENVNLAKTQKFVRYVTTSREITNKETGETEIRAPLVSQDQIRLIIMRSDADWGVRDVHQTVAKVFPNFSGSHILYYHDVDRAIIRTNNAGEFLALTPGLKDASKPYARDISEAARDAFEAFMRTQALR